MIVQKILIAFVLLSMSLVVQGAEQVLPGAADVPGLYGTEWSSELHVFNPTEESVVLEVSFFPYTAEYSIVTESAIQRTALTVGAHGLLVLDDVVGWLGQASSGWIELTSDVVVVAGQRTATTAPTGGTFGQFIAAQSTVAEQRYLTGLRGGEYRTNLGVLNRDLDSVTVTVDLASGRDLALSGEAGTQLNMVSEWNEFDPAGESGSVVSEAPLVVYASVIDNLSGDPMYVPGLRAQAQSLVAGLAHTPGANGTTWRSDLYLHAPAALTVLGTLVFYGEDGTTVEPQLEEDLETGETKVLRDVVDLLAPGKDGVAVLWLSTVSSPVVAVARTYTSATAGGTYGQTVVAVGRDQEVTPGSDGIFVMALRDPSGNVGFRTNLALVNRATSFAGFEVEVRDTQGDVVGHGTVSVPPRSGVQRNDVLAWLGLSSLDDGVIAVRGPRAFSGYLSLVDNQTGDACTVPPVAVPALSAR